MSRRMGFSVVGLPHYTIWHLYEPSVDDIKHMEVSDPGGSSIATDWLLTFAQEMERERLAREEEEKEKAEKVRRIQEQFVDANSQWEKDKSEMQNMALEEKQSKGEKAASEKKDMTKEDRTKKDTTKTSDRGGRRQEDRR